MLGWGLMHRRLWGRPLGRVLAAVGMMLLSAYCFISWVEFVLIGFKIVNNHGYSIENAAMMTGGYILYLGFAHGFIAFAAHQLGVDVRAAPRRSGRWALPKRFRREWVLSVLGTLVCIFVVGVGMALYSTVINTPGWG